VTTLIDARKPFVAATGWGGDASADHFVTVADYAVRDARRYVLLVMRGRYKWYPLLDKLTPRGRLEGFHTRWSRNWRGAGLGQKYFRIRPDMPVSARAWASWHTR
jgi:hypothetical protein